MTSDIQAIAAILRGKGPLARQEAVMTEECPMLVGAATVFVVAAMTESLTYYRKVLGFVVTFEYGQPVSYACLCRDEVAVHLIASAQTRRLPGHGSVAVFVRDVDKVYAELVSRGARLISQPQNYDYGMRDFDVVDLDGNRLTFGTGTHASI